MNVNNSGNWHNSCFRHARKYSFRKILKIYLQKRYCKDFSYSATIIEKLEGTGRTDRNDKGKLCQPLWKAREC